MTTKQAEIERLEQELAAAVQARTELREQLEIQAAREANPRRHLDDLRGAARPTGEPLFDRIVSLVTDVGIVGPTRTGRGGVRYDISWSWTDHGYRLRVGLYIDDGDAYYDQIREHRDAIDEAIKTPVSWEPLPEAKASRVVTYLEGIDPEDRDRWAEYRSWALDRLGEFRRVCQPVIDQLVA